jgi:hypothetical protein
MGVKENLELKTKLNLLFGLFISWCFTLGVVLDE